MDNLADTGPEIRQLLVQTIESLTKFSAEFEEIKGLNALLQENAATAPMNDIPLKAAVPFMPPGARSESSLRRLVRKGWIPAKRVNGRLSLNPIVVRAELGKSVSAREAVQRFLASHKRRRA